MSGEKNVLFGPTPSKAIPNESTGLLIYNQLRKFASHREALVDGISNENLTYTNLIEKTCRLAKSLTNCAIDANKVLGICSENNINFVVPVIAALYVGAPLVPINFNYNEHEIKYALQLVEPEVIFCSTAKVDTFLKLKSTSTTLKRIIVIDAVASIHGAETLNEFLQNNSTRDFDVSEYRPTNVKTNHTAFILFTAGTTGSPKAVVITHSNFNARVMLQFEPTLINDAATPIILGILPFFHAYGLSLALGSLINGRKLIVFKQIDPIVCLEAIERYKISVLYATPSIMQFIAKSPIADKYNLSSVKEIICGGAVLSEALESAVANRLNMETIRQGYGLTETTLHVTITPAGYSRPGSCGKLVPGVSGMVLNPATGLKRGPFESGELCFKGGVIMKGYYKNEAATKDTFTPDGWFRTGDLGYYDSDGYFFVVDRLQDLVNSKGFQVAPAELDGILLTHPKIQDAAVVGIPDAKAGELPVAFIVKQPGAVLTENQVKFYLGNFLPRRKHLHGGVIFTDKIPRNEYGKVLRRELREILKITKPKL